MGVKIWDLLLEDSRQWSTVVMRVNSDKFEQETLLYAKKVYLKKRRKITRLYILRKAQIHGFPC